MNDEQAARAWLTQRNQTAASLLVERYQPIIFRQIHRWVKDHEFVQDITQQTLIQMFAGLPQLKNLSNLGPWIRIIARNNCINAWKRLSRCPLCYASHSELGELESRLDDFLDPQAITAEEVRIQAAQMLRVLPKQDRKLLWMYCMRNLSADTVGSRLGISSGNVRIRVYRLHHKLRFLSWLPIN